MTFSKRRPFMVLGVFETLKAISKKTLAGVHRRISGDEEKESPESLVPSERVRSTQAPIGSSVEKPKSSTPPSSMATPPKPKEGSRVETKPNTSEVKVEFAASNSTPPPIEKVPRSPAPPPKIVTKSRFDIECELDQIRELARGKTPVPAKKASQVEVVAQGDCERRVEVLLPPNSLQSASHLVLDLQVVDRDSGTKTSESLRVDLPTKSSDRKKRFKITIDLGRRRLGRSGIGAPKRNSRNHEIKNEKSRRPRNREPQLTSFNFILGE